MPRRVVPAIVILFLLIPTGVGQARPPATNAVRKDGFTVTIAVPIDLHVPTGGRFRVPGVGSTDGAGLAGWWESGAEAIWNRGLSPFLFRGCYTLQVDIQLNVVAAGPFSGNADHHQVHLRGTGFRSKVYRGGGVPPTQDDPNPYSNNGLGYWGMVSPTTIAHEVGHLLGLADDYVNVLDSSGRVTGARSLPGRERTLMNNYRTGSAATWFDQKLVDRLGDMAGIVVELPPCFQGTVRFTQEDEQEGHPRRATVDVAVAVLAEESGEMKGRATGTFNLEGEVRQSGCSFTYSTSTAVDLELKAEGQGNGPYTVEAVADQVLDEVQRHYLCSDPVDLQLQWQIGLLVEDVVFRDGRYEYAGENSDILLYYIGR